MARCVLAFIIVLFAAMPLGTHSAIAAEPSSVRPLARDGTLSAVLTGDGSVWLTWTIDSIAQVVGLRLYRATAPEGPWITITPEPLPATSPGAYDDEEVEPNCDYWYELWAILASGEELPVTGASCTVSTPVSHTTWGMLKALFRSAGGGERSDR